MKSLSQFIKDIEMLKDNTKGIVVFDLDDTLVHCDPNAIGIVKYVNGDKKVTKRINTDDYANDPDSQMHKDWFSYEEFNDPSKVMKSIINGTPILKNLKIMDKYLNAGYEFCFLTARGCEDAVKYAINTMLMYRGKDGKLLPIGSKFNKRESAAVNDESKAYKGANDAEKKANVLKHLSNTYDYVVFVDNDLKNIRAAESLALKNLKAIKV